MGRRMSFDMDQRFPQYTANEASPIVECENSREPARMQEDLRQQQIYRLGVRNSYASLLSLSPLTRVNTRPSFLWIDQHKIEPLAKVFLFLIVKVVYYFWDGPFVGRGFPSGLLKTQTFN